MNIKIRHVEKIPGSYAETTFPAPHKAVITISRQLNKSLASYGTTMLHELLHVWMQILLANGFDPEHDFVDATEKDALRHFQRVYGKGRKTWNTYPSKK